MEILGSCTIASAKRLVIVALAAGSFAVSLAKAQTPNVDRVLNAASYTTPVAPGSLVAIFGGGLATASASAPGVPLPTSINGTQVLMNGTPAPLIFVSAKQINAQVPWG